MFKEDNSYTRVLLPIGFFGGLLVILMASEALSPMVASIVTVTKDAGTIVSPAPEVQYPKCKADEDCPLPTSYCSTKGQCTPLNESICTCSQPNVLRCKEVHSNRARFMYCKDACVETSGGAICQ